MDLRRLAIGGALIALIAIPGFSLGKLALYAVRPYRPGSDVSVMLDIHKRESPAEITRLLYSNAVIGEPRDFMRLGRLLRQWKKTKAGEYKLSPAMTPLEVFRILSSGVSAALPVMVREGENMYEIAASLQDKGLAQKDRVLALCTDPAFIRSVGLEEGVRSLEGYLFPDTYFFNRTLSPEEMLRQMVRHFFRVWGEPEKARAQELGMSRGQIVTLASMVEKETGSASERPLISSVFYNRLKKRMKLQSDPTTIYGMWKTYHGNIHRSDFLARNAYNTYYVPALPAGPIANPGKEAIHAALYPARSDYLFFVSHNDGTHEFTRSLQEHNMAVRKFQLNPKAREGKSWRDLNKKKHDPASSNG